MYEVRFFASQVVGRWIFVAANMIQKVTRDWDSSRCLTSSVSDQIVDSTIALPLKGRLLWQHRFEHLSKSSLLQKKCLKRFDLYNIWFFPLKVQWILSKKRFLGKKKRFDRKELPSIWQVFDLRATRRKMEMPLTATKKPPFRTHKETTNKNRLNELLFFWKTVKHHTTHRVFLWDFVLAWWYLTHGPSFFKKIRHQLAYQMGPKRPKAAPKATVGDRFWRGLWDFQNFQKTYHPRKWTNIPSTKEHWKYIPNFQTSFFREELLVFRRANRQVGTVNIAWLPCFFSCFGGKYRRKMQERFMILAVYHCANPLAIHNFHASI